MGADGTTDLSEALRGVVAELDEEPPRDLADAMRLELELLWSDLSSAKNYAINGRWSIACEGIVFRIVMLSRLVGPTHWGSVGLSLLEDGLYQAVYDAAGIEYEPPDMDVVARYAREARDPLRTGRAG